MKNTKWFTTISSMALCLASSVAAAGSVATKDPVDQLYNFQATGQYDSADNMGNISYTISAVGHAPRVTESGQVLQRTEEEDDAYKVLLTGAKITFNGFNPAAPIVNFSCEGCTLTYPDGSVLTSDSRVPLEGRALFLYGPVAPSDTSPVATIRMAGCSGLREIAGKGKLAGKVGSICFNGVFNFDMSTGGLPATITGASNCTIVTHTPAKP